jgi:hypothetical protein
MTFISITLSAALQPFRKSALKRQIAKALHLSTMRVDDALDLRRREDFLPLPCPTLAEKLLGNLRAFLETGLFFLFAQPFE